MSDISISFPPWMIAWFLLGEATPFITLVLMGLVAAFFFSRGTARVRRVRWLKWALAIVGGLWLGGISFWAAGLVDQIKTDIYQAQHHYRLDNATVLAGIEIPRGSWISLDEEGVLYGNRDCAGRYGVDRPSVVARRHPPHSIAQPYDCGSRDDQERDACRGCRHSRDTLSGRSARGVLRIWG